MYPKVIDTARMPRSTKDIQAARRAVMRAWIDGRFKTDAEFLASLPRVGGKAAISQSLLSNVLGGAKSFGEEIALKWEGLAGMPTDHLVRPKLGKEDASAARRLFTEGSTEPVSTEGALIRREADILNLRLVLNAVLASMARSTPGVAAELHEALLALPGHTHGYLAEAAHIVHEAREMTAKEQLSALRLVASSGVGKT